MKDKVNGVPYSRDELIKSLPSLTFSLSDRNALESGLESSLPLSQPETLELPLSKLILDVNAGSEDSENKPNYILAISKFQTDVIKDYRDNDGIDQTSNLSADMSTSHISFGSLCVAAFEKGIMVDRERLRVGFTVTPNLESKLGVTVNPSVTKTSPNVSNNVGPSGELSLSLNSQPSEKLPISQFNSNSNFCSASLSCLPSQTYHAPTNSCVDPVCNEKMFVTLDLDPNSEFYKECVLHSIAVPTFVVGLGMLVVLELFTFFMEGKSVEMASRVSTLSASA